MMLTVAHAGLICSISANRENKPALRSSNSPCRDLWISYSSGAKISGFTDHHLPLRKAGIVEAHSWFMAERIAARVEDDNGLRYSIGNPAKLPLVLQELLICHSFDR